MKKYLFLSIFMLLSYTVFADCTVNLNNSGHSHETVCYCHNVNHNPVTICTNNQGLINGHNSHVHNGTDTLGECVEIPPPLDCNDNDSCTDDLEVNGECVHNRIDNEECNPTPPLDCNDNNDCTIDTEVDHVCVHTLSDSEECQEVEVPNCNDDNDCTIDSFENDECVHVLSSAVECQPVVEPPVDNPPEQTPPEVVPEDKPVSVFEPCGEEKQAPVATTPDYLEGSGGCSLSKTSENKVPVYWLMIFGITMFVYLLVMRKGK